jgi:FtsH-binding integral membrane protein
MAFENQQTNTHSLDHADRAWAKAQMLQKTYLFILMGIGIFAGTIALVPEVPILQQAIRFLYSSPWVALIALMGMGFVVRMVAEKPGIGVIGFVAYAIFMGLIVAPAALLGPAGTTTMAALITASVFIGLTIYVFVSKADLKWMGGFLFMGLFGMIGVAIAGMIFGFHVGIWYSLAGAMLFSGFILYDTSRLLHSHHSAKPLPFAVELFTDVVILFMHLLSLLNRRD